MVVLDGLGSDGLDHGRACGRGGLIVRPALDLIRRQVQELHRARDDLEERVRQRTVELEIATERHHTLVEEFSRVARTTSVGEMATGLAHELKQPLGAIANYAEGCLVELSSPRPAIQEVTVALEKLLAATMRTGKIIERIRQFVTRQAPSASRLIRTSLSRRFRASFAMRLAHRRVDVMLDLAPDLPKILGDAVQIQQVLINLVRNSLDAMASARRSDPTVLIQTKQDDSGGVAFSVTDNGEGIAEESLSRVFEAYFSTRAGGMGMGLAISRTIVEAHQGRITFTSVPNAATTFRFTLPAAPTDNDGTNGLYRR